MSKKINGFIQIDKFFEWVIENNDKVRSTHVSLYCFLWRQNNKLMWVEWFKCPYTLAMMGSCIGSNKTYYSVLSDLKSWGLIDYIPGKNNFQSPSIKLFQLCDITQLTTQPSTQLTTQLTTHIYDKQINNKHKTTNIKRERIPFEEVEEKLLRLGFPFNACDIRHYYNLYQLSDQDIKSPLKYIQTIIMNDKSKNKLVPKLLEQKKYIPSIPPEQNTWDNHQPYTPTEEDKKHWIEK